MSYSGIDSPQLAPNKNHFNNYPYEVEYLFNSRGFRDLEWPTDYEEAQRSIWCVGDSFAVGLGSPRSHTWTYILEQQTGTRCINVSMDGASNSWIARHAIDIIETVKPKVVIIQWTYFHRRESKDSTLLDEERRLHYIPSRATLDTDNDYLDFKQNASAVEKAANKHGTKLVYSFIPNAYYKNCESLSFHNSKLEESNLSDYVSASSAMFFGYEVLDYARDSHHYDIKTALRIASEIVNLI
jgi:hypothetical protein